MELNHRAKGDDVMTIRATDYHINNNEPHSVLIHGNGVKWSLELDRKTTEYGKEHDVDIPQLLESTDLIYIGDQKKKNFKNNIQVKHKINETISIRVVYF